MITRTAKFEWSAVVQVCPVQFSCIGLQGPQQSIERPEFLLWYAQALASTTDSFVFRFQFGLLQKPRIL